jgi:hypothetical protein
MVCLTPNVGVDVADDNVLVDTTELEDEVLDGAVIPRTEHVAPRSAGSLKVSENEPLDTPYLVPTAESIE